MLVYRDGRPGHSESRRHLQQSLWQTGSHGSMKGRLVVSRSTLSLRFKLTPATRSISAMSCQACSAARWRGVCCLCGRSQGDGRIRKACRVGRGSKPKQDQGEYTPSWNLTKGYNFSKKLWEARSKLGLIMNILLSRVQKKWKE